MELTVNNSQKTPARPFLKWAGGKTQLLGELLNRLPDSIRESRTIENYVEPFVGGGAMFFCLKSKYNIKNAYLLDINKDIIVSYTSIKRSPIALIKILKAREDEYLSLSDIGKKELFNQIRIDYNYQLSKINFESYNREWVKRTADIIFLNKTCFNGLFRQNSKGEFNVPFGKNLNPTICDKKNLLEVNKALTYTKLLCQDFSTSAEFIKKDTFVYLDPPYKPIKSTSSFTSYNKNGFNNDDQLRLSIFFKEMEKRGAYLMLSNSDPQNVDPFDNYFENLYEGRNIKRVLANRMINSDSSKRGQISELIITNYLYNL